MVKNIVQGKLLLVIFALALLAGAIYSFVFVRHPRLPQSYAKAVIARCANEAYRPTCYDKEIPKLAGSISMEEAFQITKIVQQSDQTYSYCHVLGHALSAFETKKDPSKWKDVITRCPSGVCSNGCIHGAFQERFRTEALTEAQLSLVKHEFINVCEPRGNWHPTGLEQASCYHALGHLLMYITSADAKRASALCDELVATSSGRDFHQVCYDGVFMQIFQPLEPEDFALIAGKQPSAETVEAFCRPYTDGKYAACMNESWPLFRAQIMTPDGLVAFCKKVGASHQDFCYNALLYVIVVQFRFELPTIRDYCMKLPRDVRGPCAAHTASRLIETDWGNIDKAVAWCREASDYGASDACFDELVGFSQFNFQPKSQEYYHLCNSVPEPWKTRCLTYEVSR